MRTDASGRKCTCPTHLAVQRFSPRVKDLYDCRMSWQCVEETCQTGAASWWWTTSSCSLSLCASTTSTALPLAWAGQSSTCSTCRQLRARQHLQLIVKHASSGWAVCRARRCRSIDAPGLSVHARWCDAPVIVKSQGSLHLLHILCCAILQGIKLLVLLTLRQLVN